MDGVLLFYMRFISFNGIIDIYSIVRCLFYEMDILDENRNVGSL